MLFHLEWHSLQATFHFLSFLSLTHPLILRNIGNYKVEKNYESKAGVTVLKPFCFFLCLIQCGIGSWSIFMTSLVG
jgi:hypothetical protein